MVYFGYDQLDNTSSAAAGSGSTTTTPTTSLTTSPPAYLPSSLFPFHVYAAYVLHYDSSLNAWNVFVVAYHLRFYFFGPFS